MSSTAPLAGLVPGPFMFGAAPIAGLFAPVSEETAAATLAAAWAAGIRAFDTAPHYGVGLSERRLGAFLAGYPRDEFTVSTKVGRLLVPTAGDVQGEAGFYGIPPLTRVRDYSRDGVRRSLEESLERLGLDRVDIALIHDPDDFMEQVAAEAYPALASLRDQGVVRAIGAGMNSASALAWLAERCDLDCVLVAGRYTLLDQAAATELFPVCQRRGVAVLAAGVFNSGILAGPVDGGSYDYAPAPPAVVARARRMRDACARHGVPLAAAALQFPLRNPAVTAAVVGARSPDEIAEDVSYLSTHLPDALWAELEMLLPCDDARVIDEVLADQVAYYRRRAGEYDVTAYGGDIAAARAFIARLVTKMRPTGSVLEIACGTGLWTEALAGWADTVTAIDVAPEMVAIARDRVPSASVSFEVADVFSWDPATRFDVIFFSAWLSHVPTSRFGQFWQLLRGLLAGDGRVLFVDEHVDERGKETYVTGQEEVVERRLAGGSTFRVIKNFVEPAELELRLRRLGWDCVIRRVSSRWVYGEAQVR